MTKIMGIVNVTPDSFSDGGEWFEHDRAIAHARELVAQGAEIIDVGGESTRPGSAQIDAAEEIRRVLPVVEALVGDGTCVSVDTMRSETAAATIEVGAHIINDVSGGLADPNMLAVVAESDADYILMHWRGHLADPDALARYDDVVREVSDETLAQRDAAIAAGIPAERIILDPGLGFSKLEEHNWELLRRLDEFMNLGHKVLVGASRKRFLSSLDDRDLATAVISAWSAHHGVWAVRTHEVPSQVDAIRVAQRLSGRTSPRG